MRVLITGASGFIGGRILEVLAAVPGYEPVAGVRRWASAARIGRLPVEVRHLDITVPEMVREAVRGIDAVIHCAVGDLETTVEGTRNVLAAARDEGVTRFCHLSTVEVYGVTAGRVSEDMPPHRSGEAYADAKVGAEEVAREFAARGLPLVVLRPAIVYGPFSTNWTERVAERLLSGQWRRLGRIDGICNAVYVDDVAAAALLALETEGAAGGVFNIIGPEPVTWDAFYAAFNELLGLPPLRRRAPLLWHARAAAVAPIRFGARTSMELSPDLVMDLYTRSAAVKWLARRIERLVKATPPRAQLALFRRSATYDMTRAREVLGYEPRFDLHTGLELTTRWFRHHSGLGIL